MPPGSGSEPPPTWVICDGCWNGMTTTSPGGPALFGWNISVAQKFPARSKVHAVAGRDPARPQLGHRGVLRVERGVRVDADTRSHVLASRSSRRRSSVADVEHPVWALARCRSASVVERLGRLVRDVRDHSEGSVRVDLRDRVRCPRRRRTCARPHWNPVSSTRRRGCCPGIPSRNSDLCAPVNWYIWSPMLARSRVAAGDGVEPEQVAHLRGVHRAARLGGDAVVRLAHDHPDGADAARTRRQPGRGALAPMKQLVPKALMPSGPSTSGGCVGSSDGEHRLEACGPDRGRRPPCVLAHAPGMVASPAEPLPATPDSDT